MRILLLSSAALLLGLPAAAAIASEAAEPFAASRDPAARERALECLTQAVYYEARSESEDGQRAVAQVVLNRVRHPAYPNSVCGVVYQGSRAQHRLPVHLHLRRLDVRRRSSPTPGTAPGGSPRRRSAAASIARSASPPTTTPPRSSLIGRRAWSRRPWSARTSSIAGRAAAARRAPSARPLPATSPRRCRAPEPRTGGARRSGRATRSRCAEIPVVERPVRERTVGPRSRAAPGNGAPASRAAPARAAPRVVMQRGVRVYRGS